MKKFLPLRSFVFFSKFFTDNSSHHENIRLFFVLGFCFCIAFFL
jgi:hypothetical protein